MGRDFDIQVHSRLQEDADKAKIMEKILNGFLEKWKKNQKDLDPEIAYAINKSFEDLF